MVKIFWQLKPNSVELSRINYFTNSYSYHVKKYENRFNLSESECFSSNSVTELMPNIDSVLILSDLRYFENQRLLRGPGLKRRGRPPQDQSQLPVFRSQVPTQLSKYIYWLNFHILP